MKAANDKSIQVLLMSERLSSNVCFELMDATMKDNNVKNVFQTAHHLQELMTSKKGN